MTIAYPNGTVLKAVVLSQDENEILAIAAGSDDTLSFTRLHGAWISQEIEPVTIEFEWQHNRAPQACSEDDCICPKELAAHLIQTLLVGSEGSEVPLGIPTAQERFPWHATTAPAQSRF